MRTLHDDIEVNTARVPRFGGSRGLARQRPRAVAALACFLMCSMLLSGCGMLGGSGACAQGLPSMEPSRAAPGETFVLRGGGFGGGCDDSNLPFWPDPPQQDIRIEMRQEGKTWGLATVDADADYRIDETLRVPKDSEPGKAVVVVDANENAGDGDAFLPLKVPFEVLGERTP